MLKDLLEKKQCFKLVCGAGNEDVKDVEKLVALYSTAGCKFFDLSANKDIYKAAKRGLKYSQIEDANICISVGIDGDPHINKANIDHNICIKCGKCEKICPTNAIKKLIVIEPKCIGCKKCAKICPVDAISMSSSSKNLKEILPPLIEMGIDCIELHAMGKDKKEVYKNWAYINKIYSGITSICISRGNLSDEKMVNRIKKMTKDRMPYTTIIQADGFPMSGGEDDFKTTLQAVATAEIVQNEKLPLYLMLSGGTNSKTAELARLCGVDFNGIAVGSFARKIVKAYIDREDFLENKEIFNYALEVAKSLVKKSEWVNSPPTDLINPSLRA